ncbi:hypothetical protein ACHAW5_003268 [Stephanodiscus triporus]|uniref:DNA (cytosine-5-)-methyltransferase n=1 Tax=Stephanodiscus triporus TaxID=2934178 RepID=A0ABD3NPY2_9STRA
MARTKTASPDRKSSPREEEDAVRRQNNGVQEGPVASAQSGASSTASATDNSSSARRYPAPAPRGATESSSSSFASKRTNDNAGLQSFFESRGLVHGRGVATFAPPGGRHVTTHGGRGGGYAHHPRDRADQRHGESNGFNRHRPEGPGSSWDIRGIEEYRRGCVRDGRTGQDYGRSHDDRSLTTRPFRATNSDGRDSRERYWDNDFSTRFDRREHDHCNGRKKRHKIGQTGASAPAKYWQAPSHQTNQASLASAPSLALAPPAPSQGEFSENDKLKRELERTNLEKEILQANSEKKRIELENETIELKKKKIELDKKRIEQQLIQTTRYGAMPADNAAASGTVQQPPCAGNDDDMSATQQLMNTDDCEFDGADDDFPATRNSSTENSSQLTLTAPSDPPKMKSNHRGTGHAKPAESATSQQLEAQLAQSKNKKRDLLIAHKKDLAMLKKKGQHTYTERDLMSRFAPKIVDHYLLARGDKKVLVEWHDKSKHEGKGLPNVEILCPSWIDHDDFLFPALTRKYLSKELKRKNCNEKIELKTWIEDCEEREKCLNCLNNICGGDDDDDENDDSDEDTEIDFCCYLCKCPWDHPLKHTIRHCGSSYLKKYHRVCCHGYQDMKECESFVSPMGKMVMELTGESTGTKANETNREGDAIENTTHPEPEHENSTEVAQGTNSVTIVEGNSEMFQQSLQTRRKRHAVVVCINAGVGSAAVALKGLGIRCEKMIHVEADRVAQHVIRSSHDFSYGAEHHDEIKHIVGLYECIDDIAEDPDKFVQYNGPIDLVICTTPRGKSTEENVQFTAMVFELIKNLKRLNRELYKLDHLFYLLEFPSSIKDRIPLHDSFHCVWEPKNVHVCNWPIPPKIERLVGVGASKNLSGQQEDYLRQVTTLYDSLREALNAGQEQKKKWRDIIHPKFWAFLGLGPNGYDLKVSNKDISLESILLRLRSPDNSGFLTGNDYVQYLLEQSLSVPFLFIVLRPLKDIFSEMNYGRPYNVLAAQYEESRKICHSVKEEELSTDDDEQKLFDQIEGSFTTS